MKRVIKVKNCSTCLIKDFKVPSCVECGVEGHYRNWEDENKVYHTLTFDQYQASSSRTDNYADQKEAITNFAFGICGEAGEIVDLVKKVIFHGHPIDKEKFKYEIGDQLWYLARMAEWVGLTLEEVAEANINKLMVRYPNGFSQEKSINRSENDS
ncbi:MAG: nucleoside triphosphate pyrophosphohydrolase family protein [Desulfitobacterium hafniense]|nr:nucleoside triphosphate pyrophosphohydrolase family protein [Desulfitobacterium hafniense]